MVKETGCSGSRLNRNHGLRIELHEVIQCTYNLSLVYKPSHDRSQMHYTMRMSNTFEQTTFKCAFAVLPFDENLVAICLGNWSTLYFGFSLIASLIHNIYLAGTITGYTFFIFTSAHIRSTSSLGVFRSSSANCHEGLARLPT